MAGRGRGATLPAWMSSAEGAAILGSSTNNSNGNGIEHSENGQFDDHKNEIKERSSGQTGIDNRPTSSRDENPRRSRDRSDRERSDRERGPINRDRRSRSRERGDRGDRRSDRDRGGGERDRGGGRRDEPTRGGDRERRSSSPSEKAWVSRVNTRISNFDVRPPDGVELPGVGSGGLSTGVGLGGQPTVLGEHPGLNRPVGGAKNTGVYGNTSSNYGNPMMSGLQGGLGDAAAQQQTRHARRLYVGGIPPGTTDDDLNKYFQEVVSKAMAPYTLEGGHPVVNIYINPDKCFSFVELSSIELTTACLGLDGMKYEHRDGTSIIRVRRPNDFKPELMPPNLQPLANFNLAAIGGGGGGATEGVGKLFVGGLPYHLDDEQIKELLSAFGILKSFHMVREPGSVTSKGYGFCEYGDIITTQNAITGLNNLAIGEKTLTVRIATNNTGAPPSQIMTHMQNLNNPNMQDIFVGGTQKAAQTVYGGGGMGMGMPIANIFATQQPTRVLKMMNMLTREELNDDREYEDIKEDVTAECSGHGEVTSVIIPRQRDGFPFTAEMLIFVEFRDPNAARNCALALSGRKFADRTVIVDYFNEAMFAQRQFA